MIEYIDDCNEPLNTKNYRVKVGCINCDSVGLTDILKGKPIDIFIVEEKIKCPVCECIESLIPYNAWKAQKAMMNQIMNMAKHEAEAEESGKGHGHYR
jgi:hypothetical protein